MVYLLAVAPLQTARHNMEQESRRRAEETRTRAAEARVRIADAEARAGRLRRDSADLRAQAAALRGQLARQKLEGRALRGQLARVERARQDAAALARAGGGPSPLRDEVPAAVQLALADGLPTGIGDGLVERQVLRDGGDPEASGPSFAMNGPFATAVVSDRPLFSWKRFPGAARYEVIVLDTVSDTVVAQTPGGGVFGNSWRPATPLPRGRVYLWQVEAFGSGRDGGGLARGAATGGLVPRFRIVDAKQAAELEAAARTFADAPLVRGILHARAGVLDTAEAELGEAARKDPRAARLLKQIRNARPLTIKPGQSAAPGDPEKQK
jgi:hypothetical protein